MAKSDEFDSVDFEDDDVVDEEIVDEELVDDEIEIDEELVDDVIEDDEELVDEVLEDDEDVIDDVLDDAVDAKDAPFDDDFDDEELVDDVVDDVDDEVAALDDDSDDFGDGDDDLGDEDSFDDDDFFEEEEPAAQTHYLTYILAFLNIAAAIGFAVMLVYDLGKRREWTYAAFLHDLSIQGLPFASEKDGPTGSRLIGPREQFTGERLQKVFQNRGGKAVAEKFLSIEEVFEYRIRPQHLTTNILDEWFQHIGKNPVATLEEEVHRVKAEVFPKIKDAAKKVANSKLLDKAKKQSAMRVLLYPLAFSPLQVEQVEHAIQSTPDPTAMLEDAVQRRTLYDILALLDHHRAAELKDDTLRKIVDFPPVANGPKDPPPPPRTPKDYVVQLDQLEKLLDDRFKAAVADKYDPKLHYGDRAANPQAEKDEDKEEIRYAGQTRSSTEKRKTIATLLFTLGQTKLPGGDEKLPMKMSTNLVLSGLPRVEGVIGTYEYALAFGRMTLALHARHKRYLNIIRVDRDGDFVLSALGVGYDRLPGFVDRYESLVKEIRDVRESIKRHNDWLTEALAQKTELEQLYKDRVLQLNDITTKLVARRGKTKQLFDKLRKLQERLFIAQVRLADANATNLRLERQISELEYKLKRKGGKK